MIEATLFRRCMRRWYVLLLGVLLTAAAAASVSLLPGVYWARTQVLLLGPPSETRPNKLDSNSAGLIATAGLVERELNAGRQRIPATSIDVTLVDQGVYDGEQVRLPNNGGQWATNFDQPVLDIQASGPSSAIVQERIDKMVKQTDQILQRRQNEAGVGQANRITVALSPPVVETHYAQGDRQRAAFLTITLGLSLTLWSVIFTDKRLTARRTRDKLRPPPVLGETVRA
jgi:hypothetical protein